MKKVLSLFVITLVVLIMSGCMADSYEPSSEFGDDYNDVNTDPEQPAPVIDEPEIDGGDVVQTAAVPALEDRKIIYTADLKMNSPEPETVYNDVLSILDTYSAYVESADINENRYIVKLRVLTDNFTDFVEEIKTNGDMLSFTKTSEDITNAYSTYEIKLAALQARHDRILELIDTAVDLDVILQLEEERYEIEVELNQIGQALGEFDSLIDFSTVDLTIYKTVEQEVILPKTSSPTVYVSEVTKRTATVEVRNNSDESANIYVDLLINGEFVRQYEDEAFEDGTAIFELGDLKSNTEYQLRISVISAGYRESNTIRNNFLTEATFWNKVGNVFVGSFDVLVIILEFLGLAIVAILPFAIVGAIVFFPGRIVYKKYLKKPLAARKERVRNEKAARAAQIEIKKQEFYKQQRMRQQQQTKPRPKPDNKN